MIVEPTNSFCSWYGQGNPLNPRECGNVSLSWFAGVVEVLLHGVGRRCFMSFMYFAVCLEYSWMTLIYTIQYTRHIHVYIHIDHVYVWLIKVSYIDFSYWRCSPSKKSWQNWLVLEMVEKHRARLRMCKEGLLQERRMPWWARHVFWRPRDPCVGWMDGWWMTDDEIMMRLCWAMIC